MIEIQDHKSTGLATGQRHASGSVPVILPQLRPPFGTKSAGPARDVSSMFLIVVMPTVFWCAIINVVRSLMGLETGHITMVTLVLVIAGFLSIIRASLTIDRST